MPAPEGAFSGLYCLFPLPDKQGCEGSGSLASFELSHKLKLPLSPHVLQMKEVASVSIQPSKAEHGVDITGADFPLSGYCLGSGVRLPSYVTLWGLNILSLSFLIFSIGLVWYLPS